MRKIRNRMTAILLVITLALLPIESFAVTTEFTGDIDAKSAILMEASTGKILYENNADEALPPASVTKIMTVLLVAEAIDAGKITVEDEVTVSAYATSMGGSQIYLKENEIMTVNDLLKSVVVASANDAAVALAEYLCGSEATFVARMNERAVELGMKNTTFKNTNGLDDSDEGHLTSARDIAIMSRELLKHSLIFNYSCIWMDTVRNGAFGLTNTNRLIRFYNGANGLKTGSTSKAKFCISATAKRDDMQLIAVVMASSTRDARNALATSLLDYGFSNYALTRFDGGTTEPLRVLGGIQNQCKTEFAPFEMLSEKSETKPDQKIKTLEKVAAPIKKGDVVGHVTYTRDGATVGTTDIIAAEAVEKISYFRILKRLLGSCCFAS